MTEPFFGSIRIRRMRMKVSKHRMCVRPKDGGTV
jgi:hypothetical protein